MIKSIAHCMQCCLSFHKFIPWLHAISNKHAHAGVNTCQIIVTQQGNVYKLMTYPVYIEMWQEPTIFYWIYFKLNPMTGILCTSLIKHLTHLATFKTLRQWTKQPEGNSQVIITLTSLQINKKHLCTNPLLTILLNMCSYLFSKYCLSKLADKLTAR